MELLWNALLAISTYGLGITLPCTVAGMELRNRILSSAYEVSNKARHIFYIVASTRLKLDRHEMQTWAPYLMRLLAGLLSVGEVTMLMILSHVCYTHNVHPPVAMPISHIEMVRQELLMHTLRWCSASSCSPERLG